MIIHQPRFPLNKGISLPQLPFEVRSCEVAIIWPDAYMMYVYIHNIYIFEFIHIWILFIIYTLEKQSLADLPQSAQNHYFWNLAESKTVPPTVTSLRSRAHPPWPGQPGVTWSKVQGGGWCQKNRSPEQKMQFHISCLVNIISSMEKLTIIIYYIRKVLQIGKVLEDDSSSWVFRERKIHLFSLSKPVFSVV